MDECVQVYPDMLQVFVSTCQQYRWKWWLEATCLLTRFKLVAYWYLEAGVDFGTTKDRYHEIPRNETVLRYGIGSSAYSLTQ